MHSEAIAFLTQADSVLADVIQRIGPYEPEFDQGDLFSCLAEAIIHQQLSTKVARTIHRRFLALYSEEAHPTPEDVLNTPDETLRGAGISYSKISYLKDLSAKVQAGLPPLEELEHLDDEAVIQTLTPIKGIGRWSVQMLLIFRMQRPDVLPVDDLGLRTAIRNAYQLSDLPNKKTVQQIGDRWSPYRSIASLYLWRSLDSSPPK